MKIKRQKKKTCHKVEYRSREEAKKALDDFGRARGSKRYYKCPYHNGREVWHLTSHDS